MAQISYATAVGHLIYAMMCTKLDISQAVSKISRQTHNPDRGYWQAVKQNLQYILGTVNVGLKLQQDKKLDQVVVMQILIMQVI